MDEVLEQHAVDLHAFSDTMISLHEVIKCLSLQDLNSESGKQLNISIKKTIAHVNQFARDIALCGSKKVPWKYAVVNKESTLKRFLKDQYQAITSVWQEDTTFTLEHELFTQKVLDIVLYCQKILIHAGICLDLYLKKPTYKHKQQCLITYKNLRQIFIIQKQFARALQGIDPDFNDLFEIRRILNEISHISKNVVPAYDKAALIEQNIAHTVGTVIDTHNKKALFAHAVVDGILRQEELSSKFVSMLDPALSPENLQRIEQSKTMMGLIKIFAKKKYEEMKEGIDQGVPPSVIIKGIQEYFDTHPPLASIKPPVLAILKNKVLSTWIINPVACIASFWWHPLQYPLKAIETLAQEMKNYQVSANPRFTLHRYLKRNIEDYYNKGAHLLCVPCSAQKVANPNNMFFETDFNRITAQLYAALKNSDQKKAIDYFIVQYRSYYDLVYKRYFSYKAAHFMATDGSMPLLNQQQIFNYWLRALVQKQNELIESFLPTIKKPRVVHRFQLNKPLKSIFQSMADVAILNTNYVEDPVAQEHAAWLAMNVDTLFEHNIKPELRKTIKTVR